MFFYNLVSFTKAHLVGKSISQLERYCLYIALSVLSAPNDVFSWMKKSKMDFVTSQVFIFFRLAATRGIRVTRRELLRVNVNRTW